MADVLRMVSFALRSRGYTALAGDLERAFDAIKAQNATLRAQVEALTAERDEADRRAGAAERKLEKEESDSRRHADWLRDAKEEAGYHSNTSFDVVWAETLAGKRAAEDALAAEKARADRAEAVVAAARCIRHWGDAMHSPATGECEGMVVSAAHVRALWDALAALRPTPLLPPERNANAQEDAHG